MRCLLWFRSLPEQEIFASFYGALNLYDVNISLLGQILFLLPCSILVSPHAM